MGSVEISEVCPVTQLSQNRNKARHTLNSQTHHTHTGPVASAKNRCLQSDVLKLRPSHRKIKTHDLGLQAI